MIVTEQFFKAKKDKDINSLIVCLRDNRTYMYLCIRQPQKYDLGVDNIFVETDTKFKINNCSPLISKTGEYSGKTDYIVFYLDYMALNGDSHVKTFLDTIKKDSDVSFYIVAYNGCDTYNALNLVSHQLYGLVNGNRYLLQDYVGKDNSASPVRAYM